MIKGVKVPVFTILTTEAADEIRFIHDRMPVMLAEDDVDRWVGMKTGADNITKSAIDKLLAIKNH